MKQPHIIVAAVPRPEDLQGNPNRAKKYRREDGSYGDVVKYARNPTTQGHGPNDLTYEQAEPIKKELLAGGVRAQSLPDPEGDLGGLKSLFKEHLQEQYSVSPQNAQYLVDTHFPEPQPVAGTDTYLPKVTLEPSGQDTFIVKDYKGKAHGRLLHAGIDEETGRPKYTLLTTKKTVNITPKDFTYEESGHKGHHYTRHYYRATRLTDAPSPTEVPLTSGEDLEEVLSRLIHDLRHGEVAADEDSPGYTEGYVAKGPHKGYSKPKWGARVTEGVEVHHDQPRAGAGGQIDYALNYGPGQFIPKRPLNKASYDKWMAHEDYRHRYMRDDGSLDMVQYSKDQENLGRSPATITQSPGEVFVNKEETGEGSTRHLDRLPITQADRDEALFQQQENLAMNVRGHGLPPLKPTLYQRHDGSLDMAKYRDDQKKYAKSPGIGSGINVKGATGEVGVDLASHSKIPKDQPVHMVSQESDPPTRPLPVGPRPRPTSGPSPMLSGGPHKTTTTRIPARVGLTNQSHVVSKNRLNQVPQDEGVKLVNG